MAITDELRRVAAKTECANGRCEKLYRGDLERIADRIDAEHESMFRSLTIDAEPMTDESMAEHGWIRLPVDADGVPIHVGDRLDGYGKTIEVVELRSGRGGWTLMSRGGYGYVDTFAFVHHHAPTVKDVLLDFGWGWHEHMDEPETFDITEYVERYAAKLRLAGEDA